MKRSAFLSKSLFMNTGLGYPQLYKDSEGTTPAMFPFGKQILSPKRKLNLNEEIR